MAGSDREMYGRRKTNALYIVVYRIALIFRGSKFSRIASFFLFRRNNFANALLNTSPMWLNFEVSKYSLN